MPSYISFYTTGNMEKAKLHNIPNYSSGYPPLNALDNNLDTYWKAGAGIAKDYQVDLQESKSVGCVTLFCKNYLSATGLLDLYRSSDGSTWTSVFAGLSMSLTSTPVRNFTIGSPQSYRYWRIVLSTAYEYKIAGLWFGKASALIVANLAPQNDEDEYHNEVVELAGERVTLMGMNRKRTLNYDRRYYIQGDSDFNILRDAIEDSKGKRHLLCFKEDGMSYGEIVRFADDIFVRQLIQNVGSPLRLAEIRLEQVPYIDDGDSY